MPLSFICIEKNVSEHSKTIYGGYTVIISSINLKGSVGFSCLKPDGSLITQAGFVLGLGGTAFVYPGSGEPLFTALLTAVGENFIGNVMVKFATLKLCAYVEPAPTPGTGDTHLECVNGICTRVPGFGPDSNCIEGQPCGTTTPPPTEPPTPTGDTHLECVSGICTRVPGFGPDANCIEGQPCTTTIPPPPADEVLPSPPVLGPEPPLDYSGLLAFLESLYNRIRWMFNFVFDSLEWIISALGILIPKLFKFILYILSLQWVADIVQAFFERLDIWVSLKFGIDPALPFWEELVKRAIAWLSAGIDEAAGKAIERLK